MILYYNVIDPAERGLTPPSACEEKTDSEVASVRRAFQAKHDKETSVRAHCKKSMIISHSGIDTVFYAVSG